MAITRITSTTEIKAGQWVCKHSIFTDGICSTPKKVIRVAGQRIYITNRSGEDDGEYMARNSVVFICDAQDEGLRLRNLSDEQVKAIIAATKAIKAEHDAKINALIAEAA